MHKMRLSKRKVKLVRDDISLVEHLLYKAYSYRTLPSNIKVRAFLNPFKKYRHKGAEGIKKKE